jgi:multiple sugar transport system ATP-binding protein
VTQVAFESVSKVYDDGTVAVNELDLVIDDGEFMVFVGPSGCGKTTALRMVAGLEQISDGTIRIGDRPVNDVAPKDRDIAMVFQNYALYPHMTVEDNLSFGLKIGKLPKSQIAERVRAAANILGIEEYLGRKPRALSGGQRQRVAMGRAIVREPQAFLMDEPLSNLDAKLRVQMRAEIHELQRRLGVTTIYVTHDQVEAMTMGDRVAVLQGGKLQQVDTPQTLYDRPTNRFVAGFIGSPSMNMVDAELTRGDRGLSLRFGDHQLGLADDFVRTHPGLDRYVGRGIVLGIRPEDIEDAEFSPNAGPEGRITATCTLTEALGSEVLVYFAVDASKDTETVSAPRLVARVSPRTNIREGARMELVADTRRLHFFDPDTGAALGSGSNSGSA